MNTCIALFKKYGAYLGLLGLLVLFFPQEYKDFWEYWWVLLIIIMFLSPTYKLFPKFSYLGKILPLRRQFGIICASFIIAHGVWAYMVGWRVDGGTFTNPSDFLLWGVLGWVVALPLLATSNNFAVKKLKKYWKVLQRLAYAMFLFWALHIYFIEKEIGILILLWVWVVMKILVMKKIVLWK